MRGITVGSGTMVGKTLELEMCALGPMFVMRWVALPAIVCAVEKCLPVVGAEPKTGKTGDAGDGRRKALARSRAATMAASTEDLKGMLVLARNHVSVLAMRSELIAHANNR
jgi:hypothetical protein